MDRRSLLVVGFLILGLWAVSKVDAAYNAWKRYSSGTRYHYRSYYYYTPKRYHYAYYYPHVSKQYVYYYNPYKKRYWGRYDTTADMYSLLAPEDRKENFDDIKKSAFPKAGPNWLKLGDVKIQDDDLPGGGVMGLEKPPSLPE